MDIERFKAAYNESRNGANYFVNHQLRITPGGVPFHYSDGVKDCADAGCYWLLDVIATECPGPLRTSGDVMSIVEVEVNQGKADLRLTISDNAPPIWSKHVDLTDMPDGRWVFELVDEGERFALALLTEH